MLQSIAMNSMFSRKTRLILYALIASLWDFPVWAQVDPTLDWKVLTSDHFEVIYNAKYQNVANEYLRQAERSYALLAPIFQETPDRTLIVIDDSTDATNGLATPIPQPNIQVHPALPLANDSLDSYGNWAQGLVIHEYAHILNFEPTHGWLKPLRWIFGSIVRPNSILPRWYTEGLAVDIESRFTKHGRLRSTLYRAMVRAMKKENTWATDDISQINEVRTPTWPAGMRPYFYGSLIWQDLVRTKSTSMMYDLNQRYSQRVPFFINAPIEDATGRDWQGYLDALYLKRGAQAKEELNQIENPVNGDLLAAPPETLSQRAVALSPDGLNLVFVNHTFHDKEQVILKTRRSPKIPFSKDASTSKSENEPRVLFAKDEIERLSWFPDSNSFVFDAVDTFDRYYLYSDLYRYHLNTKKISRLTKGLRAHAPSVSPDGNKIVFVQNSQASTSLSMMRSNGSQLKTLYQPPLQTRISGPTFISNSEIVFSERDLDGIENAKILNLKTNQIDNYVVGIGRAKFVTATRKGLVFTSDETGVSNLYFRNFSSGRVVPLTRTSTHVYDGALDDSTAQVFATELSGYGSRVVALPRELPKKSSSLEEEKWSGGANGGEISEPKLNYQTEESDYSGLGYLLPKYWIPFFSFIPGGFVVQANIHGQDPLQKHVYDAQVGYDNLTNRASTAFVYKNNVTPITAIFRASDIYSYLYANSQTVENTAFSGGADFFLPGLSNTWRGGLSWNYLSAQNPNLVGDTSRSGPSIAIRAGKPTQRGYQVAPENEGEFEARYTQFLKGPGSFEYGQAEFAGSYFFSRWIPSHNVIALKNESLFTPENRSILLGTAVGGAEFFASLLKSHYIIRGYPVGEFLGWSMITTNLEYIFPLSYRFVGFDTKPIFLRTLAAAVVGDTATVEGAYYDLDTKRLVRTHLGNFFWGAGAELRADVTLFYHLPGLLRFGLYYGFNRQAYGGLSPYLGIGIEGF